MSQKWGGFVGSQHVHAQWQQSTEQEKTVQAKQGKQGKGQCGQCRARKAKETVQREHQRREKFFFFFGFCLGCSCLTHVCSAEHPPSRGTGATCSQASTRDISAAKAQESNATKRHSTALEFTALVIVSHVHVQLQSRHVGSPRLTQAERTQAGKVVVV